MSDAPGIATDRDATDARLAERWLQHVKQVQEAESRGKAQAEAPPQIAFVQSALNDLHRSLVHLPPGACERWFPTAFNDWYCPAVRRGYCGGMAPVFDIGVVLMEPGAEIRADGGHAPLLHWMQENPFVGELAARATSGRGSAPLTADLVGLITWIMVEPLLRCLSGVWDLAATAARPRELPIVERRRDGLWIYANAYATKHFHELRVRSIDPARAGPSDNPNAPAPPASTRQYRPVTGCAIPTGHALGVRLFAAQIAKLLPELAHKLDHELVEACLLAPLLRPCEHEPPRRLPSDVATTRQSKQPGTIAGVTRAETRRPGDPLIDILPSELMILRYDAEDRSRRAGFGKILYGRPLVLVHEREWDIIPKHRALVCFMADAHQSSASNWRILSGHYASGCPYRDGYVYSKRQVLDMLHDLADAQALAQRTAEVRIEAAVFAIPPGRENAVVHQRIALDALKRATTGDSRRNRLNEMVDMAERMPAYFIRYMDDRDRSVNRTIGRPGDVLPSDVAAFLRKAAQQGRYRVIHLVMVGLEKASKPLERLHRSLHYQSATPVRIALIGVNLNALDSDARLMSLREPAWTYVEASSIREAIELNAVAREPMPLSTLRARLVESIFGKEIEPSEAQLSRIRSY
jgi:hypothetical protein